MKKKLFIITGVVGFVCFLGLMFFYYRIYRENKINTNELIIYNPETSRWEKLSKSANPISKTERENISKNNDDPEGIHNETVLKGYLDQYDEETNELTIKSLQAYTQGVFETAKIKLSPKQIVYCAPETYTDPNTGLSHDLKKLVIPTKPGATLWIPTEREISFEDFLKKSNEKTFLYVQLTQNYNSQETNYVQKLIVIGLCE